MCNDYRLIADLGLIEAFSHTRIPLLSYPEGRPNIEPRQDICITDRAPIIRAAAGEAETAELVQRRWSWPGPGGRPVFNFRSEGRDLVRGRCLIPADGFYEFTRPADPAAKRKDKWLFTMKGEELFAIAGLWRDSEAGEAFTMLTLPPGPDVAPYHDRQVEVLTGDDWGRWLDPAVPAQELLHPLPAGSLAVEKVR